MAIATALARSGDDVVITSRSAVSGGKAAELIARRTGSHRVRPMELDLADLRSVEKLVSEYRARRERLHVLSLNAGIVSANADRLPNGCSRVFAVNYLGHFHLTRLLIDLLKAGAPARVIAVAGNAVVVKRLRVDLEALCGEGPYRTVRDTLGTALLKTMFVFELARRLEGSGVTANAFHPGLVKSRLAASLPFPLNLGAGFAAMFMRRDCPTGEYLANAAEVEGESGGFYENLRRIELDLKHHGPKDWKKLWERTEAIIDGV
jgi:NAD(P)-dependent dehydrogenase (short-subunit alcohol dehydrogenase family)